MWRPLALGLGFVTSVASTTLGTDIGLNPWFFDVGYHVNGMNSPQYVVEPRTTDVFNPNTSRTPFLLACQVESFGFNVVADSTLTSQHVFWEVIIKFFQFNRDHSETQIVSHGCLGDTTFDVGVGQVTGVLNPGASAEAGFTPLNAGGNFCQWQFQPTELQANTPVRMEIELKSFQDQDFKTPVSDTDPRNDRINFWVMRVC
jgi:hypothetical protein